MPDIDIDFDDEGRGRVMDYVIKKVWCKSSGSNYHLW
jgi:DNA polymerase III alpha subunit